MLTLKDLENCCKDLSAQVNDEFSVPILINPRLTSALGICRYQGNDISGYEPTSIEISERYLNTASNEDILHTIKHEWCHYYVTKLTRERHGHDKLFKSMCKHVGIKDTRQHELDKVTASNLYEQKKYTVYCPTCGRSIAGFDRMCNSLKGISFCTCKTCGKNGLYYKQNW